MPPPSCRRVVHIYIIGLVSMLLTCTKQPFFLHHPNKSINLLWWLGRILAHTIIQPIFSPSSPLDLLAYLNTSSGGGISITIKTRWRAWWLQVDWSIHQGKRDIGWAEAISFELLIYAIDTLLKQSTDLIIYGDNTGTVSSWCIRRYHNQLTPFSRASILFSNLPNISYPSYSNIFPV